MDGFARAKALVAQELSSGRHQEAENLARSFAETDPGAGCFLLGLVCLETGQVGASVEHFDRAAAYLPDSADLAYSHGLALLKSGDAGAALEKWLDCLRRDSRHLGARFNLARLASDLGDVEAAIDGYENLLRLAPDHLLARYNLGNLYYRSNRPADALAAFEQVLAAEANFAPALSNAAMALRELNRWEKADALYERALGIDSGSAQMHWNRSLVQLGLGHWRQGWDSFEWRLQLKETAPPDLGLPQASRTADLANKRVLVTTEQGHGDSIMFLRFLPLVQRKAAAVSLFCQPALKRLAQMRLDIEAYGYGETPPQADIAFPLLSLPRLFGVNEAAEFWTGPYLPPKHRQSTGADAKKLRIGLAWAGGAAYSDDAKRSLTADALAGLNLPGTEFHSLMVDDSPAPAFCADHRSELRDFCDTAELIDGLDLVISVDTAVAHLAGAAGKPTWIMLPFAADWRWGRDIKSSPWYPSVKLFRQRKAGMWQEVLQDIALELSSAVKDKKRI